VKSPRGAQNTGASGVRARKLDRSFNTLAARASKKHLLKATTGALAKPRGKLPGELGDVTLQHRRTRFIKLVFDSRDDAGMIVTYVMNAVPRIKVQDSPPVSGVKLGSAAVSIAHVHLQNVEQSNPLGVDVPRIEVCVGLGSFQGLKHA
jgi:hypothetical protein